MYGCEGRTRQADLKVYMKILINKNRKVLFVCVVPPQMANRFIGILVVGLGHTLQLVFLPGSAGIGGALGRIDEVICQALGHGPDTPEGSLASHLCPAAKLPDLYSAEEIPLHPVASQFRLSQMWVDSSQGHCR